MSNFPCPAKVDCPGSDDPFANLSAEGYDHRAFFRIIYSPQWRGQCCDQYCESFVSQAVADLCADNKALISSLGACSPVLQADGSVSCADAEAGCPDCDPKIAQIFWNTEQCWSSVCSTGQTFYSCIPAHTVSATSQDQADAIALSMAKNNVPAQRFCIGPTLVMCCQNSIVFDPITITGGLAAFSWASLAGGLPIGTALIPFDSDQRILTLNGTPTVAGLYSLLMQVLDARGNINMFSLVVSVLGMTPATLPDATIGVAYSQQLTAVGVPTGMTAVFSLSSGSLPTGLTLTSAGLISGTPTGGLPATFTIKVTVT